MYSVDEQYRYIKVLFYLFHLIKVLRFGEFESLLFPALSPSLPWYVGTPSILPGEYRRIIRKSGVFTLGMTSQ